MKSSRKCLVLLGMLFAIVFTSCTTFRAEGLAFSPMTDNVEVLGTFSKSKTVHEFLGTPGGANLFNISAATMSDKVSGIIWKEILEKGGNGARNITISYSAGPLAYLANTITFGIWAPAKLKISGEVIRTGTQTANVDTTKAIESAVTEFKK